jgi:membrane protein DedA with SNARE-associated domain
MEAFLQNMTHSAVEFIRLHHEWAFPIIFLVSFGESFVGVSLFFPGTTILVLAGMLVESPFNPNGALSIWPVLAGAIGGAVIGDSISFWLGQRFGHLLDKHWYFQRHPDLLPRGYRYFEKYGTASVFVGRFFGPVRAVIPLVAGIMAMPTRKFWFANVASAFLWAPALMLFGTFIHKIIEWMGTAHGMRLVVGGAVVVAIMIAIWVWPRFQVRDRITGTSAGG